MQPQQWLVVNAVIIVFNVPLGTLVCLSQTSFRLLVVLWAPQKCYGHHVPALLLGSLNDCNSLRTQVGGKSPNNLPPSKKNGERGEGERRAKGVRSPEGTNTEKQLNTRENWIRNGLRLGFRKPYKPMNRGVPEAMDDTDATWRTVRAVFWGGPTLSLGPPGPCLSCPSKGPSNTKRLACWGWVWVKIQSPENSRF